MITLSKPTSLTSRFPRLPNGAPPLASWHEVDRALRDFWEAGQHVSVIAQTGFGKSYLIVRGLLPLRERVIVLDVKGDDPTLLKNSGLRKVKRFPSRLEQAWDTANERPLRYRLHAPYGAPGTTLALDNAFRGAWKKPRGGESEGWTIFADEARILADPAYLKMKRHLDVVWLTGRSRPVTLIAGTQQPVFMPSAFYTQPRWLFIGQLRDKRAVNRLAEIGGDVDMLRDQVPRLKQYEFIMLGPDGLAVRTKYSPRRGRP